MLDIINPCGPEAPRDPTLIYLNLQKTLKIFLLLLNFNKRDIKYNNIIIEDSVPKVLDILNNVNPCRAALRSKKLLREFIYI